MGMKAEEPLNLESTEIGSYLRANHALYMEYAGKLYYITNANDIYWRAQDTSVLNHKDHYTDCTELVPTISEFLGVPIADGKNIKELYDDATFYASVKQ